MWFPTLVTGIWTFFENYFYMKPVCEIFLKRETNTCFLESYWSPINTVWRISTCIEVLKKKHKVRLLDFVPKQWSFLYAFIWFTFQGWIQYRSFCSGRTLGVLVKTIKYSKFWIILLIGCATSILLSSMLMVQGQLLHSASPTLSVLWNFVWILWMMR